MARRTEYLPIIQWFFDEVDSKLGTPKNVSKVHWQFMDCTLLLQLLKDEIKELEIELEGKTLNKSAIINECADVAAFAMMIADNTKRER